MLGLKAIVKQAVIDATVAIGDGATDITYIVVAPGTYDPVDDTINPSLTLVPMTVPKVRISDDSPDYKRSVRHQAKFILPEFEVASVVYTPKEADRIDDGTVVYTISKITHLPGATIVVGYAS